MSSHTPIALFRGLAASGVIATSLVTFAATHDSTPSDPLGKPASAWTQSYGKLPLSFEANRGQADPNVKFLSRGSGYALYLTNQAAWLQLGTSAGCASAQDRDKKDRKTQAKAGSTPCAPGPGRNSDLVGLALDGATPNSRALAEDELPGKVNYFIGNDPAKWHKDLPTYAKVRYSGVYPGVDLIYYGNQGRLEYDFVVAPNASPAPIRLRFTGEKHLRIDPSGDLILQGAHGTAAFHQPVIYQEKNGLRQSVAGSFRLAKDNTVSFSIAGYDRTRPLVIDPVLVYSTYLGGSGTIWYAPQGDHGNGVALDTTGNAYIVGAAWSPDFPITPHAFQSTLKEYPANGGSTVFISKLNATGTALVYSTFLGGSGLMAFGFGDEGTAIAVDSSQNVYVTGATYSFDFPVTPGAFQTANPTYPNDSTAAFVTKLNPSGNALVYSTYLGGVGASEPIFYLQNVGQALTVDAAGAAYIAGYTYSFSFPVTAGAFQSSLVSTVAAGRNAFVTKLNSSGTALVYSTYLGGTVRDQANAIAIDGSGNAYVAGSATSADFPVTAGAFQTVNRGFPIQASNAFVTELNPSGTAEVYSTFLGGTGHVAQFADVGDSANAIFVDGTGAAYVAGSTDSSDFPLTPGVLQTTSGTTAFLTKFTPDGSALQYSTLLGGNDGAAANALVVDGAGYAYVAGITAVKGFQQTGGALVSDPIANATDFTNAFVAKVNPTGTALDFANLLGGTSNSQAGDRANALALDATGDVFVTGDAITANFPVTRGVIQRTNKAAKLGSSNAFVSKLALAAASTDYLPSTVNGSGASSPYILLGQPATVYATVDGVSGKPAPTGHVYFSALGAAPIRSNIGHNGYAAATSSTLPVGSYVFTPWYEGDKNYLTSTGQGSSFSVIGPVAKILLTTAYPSINYGSLFPAPLIATVTDPAGKALPGLTVTFSGSGLAFSPTSAVTDSKGRVSTQPSAPVAGSLVATASIQGATVTGALTLNVQPVPLLITVASRSRLYGSVNPTFSYNIEGLIGTDSVVVGSPQTTATQASPTGTYPITVMDNGIDAPNYKITLRNGTLSVLPAPLRVTAKTETVLYGQSPAPPTAYEFTGFVNGDTASVVSGAPILSTTVTSSTPAGSYPIDVQLGTLVAPNYKIQTTGNEMGVVEVKKTLLVIAVNNLTMHRGDPVPPLTYTLTGFVNGESAATATSGSPILSTAATSSSGPGRYSITATDGTLASHNYYFTQTPGVLTVLP